MNMTDSRLAELMRLLDEIDREAYGRCRIIRIANLTRMVRLVIKKSRKNDRYGIYCPQGDRGHCL